MIVSPERLELLEPIPFTKATLDKAAYNLIGQVGATLRAHPEIVRVRIVVHVAATARPGADQELSEQRAAALNDWLVAYGISGKRLEAHGYGGTQPLVDSRGEDAPTMNERVELVIVERE